MGDEAAVRQVLASLVGDNEETSDTLDYLAGMLADPDTDLDDSAEDVAGMLEGVGVVDAEAVAAKAIAAIQSLSGSGGDAGAGAPHKLLNTPVVLAEHLEEMVDVMAMTDPSGKRKDLTNEVIVEKGGEASAGSKEQKKAAAFRAQLADDAASEAAAMQAELEAARVRAARIRMNTGATPMGTLEMGPFNLPNPGGGADLIEGASLVLVPGHRYGLIGRNGKGKSTLLKFLASRRVGGMDPSLSVHYVSQDVTLTAEAEKQPPVELVLQADVARRVLLEEQAALLEASDDKSVARLEVVTEQLTAIGAASAPARAATLLANLGFTDALASRPMEALSGGWRVRTMLAAALFCAPDVLLLDEPTNHLSIAAVLWLSRELAQSAVWKERVIVVVSHDRHFLDDATTDSLHISGIARRLASHGMAYSKWAQKRREQQLALKRRVELRNEKIATLEEFAGHGFRYGGSSSAINMMKKKEMEAKKLHEVAGAEAEQLADLEEDGELPLQLAAGGELRLPIAVLAGVKFGYPNGPTLFAGVDMTLDSTSRVCLLGENGEGKTTLVKVMLGELDPTGGEVTRDRGARVALVNQHHSDQLAYDMTPLAFMLGKFPGDGSYTHEQAVRGHLSGCGVLTPQQTVPSGALSGGQRSRVAMAAVSFARPHLLILDEPTNNLDLEAVAALADAVESFKGGVVLVSHDQYFVQRVAREVHVVGGGKLTKLDSFDAYKKDIAKGLPEM
eukprot:m.47955 g.47955  ORF g.47955 m.47955 type:complete len:733 (-) comp15756_c0_seq1:125-2323(-)